MKLSIGTDKTLTMTHEEFQALRELLNMVTDKTLLDYHAEDIYNMTSEKDVHLELGRLLLQQQVRQFFKQA